MNILGISCFYHDSAACLVSNGLIAGAVQEDRFTRKKHDSSFPLNAIRWCIKENSLSINDLDCIVFYEKPFVKFERILETALSYAPSGIGQFLQAMPLWVKQKLWIPEIIRSELGYKGEILFCSHHESHAASAFYPSPFEKSAFLTMDGVGEWETACFGVGSGNSLEFRQHLQFPHSLGLLYSAFTYYAGFKVNSGEYKLMGLAPYGKPRYASLIFDKLIDIKDDGSFKLNLEYFGYCNGLRMTNRKFERLFQAPPRMPEAGITEKEMDLAASIQKVTEEIMLKVTKHVHKETGLDNLCLAGGVALNCVANGRILREGPFKDIWIQPASGDAGGALGAALAIWHRYKGNKRKSYPQDNRQNFLLGPSYDDNLIEKYLVENKIKFEKVERAGIPAVIAKLIEEGNVIGWFQGKMEFGPRALGARSIIADPRDAQMQSKINLKIKFRESFRPFAPTVLKEEAAKWFELEKESPYMLLVAPVKKDKRLGSEEDLNKAQGFDKLKQVRSMIPAVTHVDYSARIQTIDRHDNPLYYDTIKEFFKKTGCPAVVNTSFNIRGEPLVCTPQDAFNCFLHTGMDYLLMGSYLLDKRCQDKIKQPESYLASFELD